MKPSSHWLTAALLFLLLIPFTWGLWYYRIHEYVRQRQVEPGLDDLAETTAQAVALWRTERLAEGARLAHAPELRALVGQLSDDAQLSAPDTLALSQTASFDELLLADFAGAVRLSEPDVALLLAPAEWQALAVALREHRPQLAELARGPERSTLTLSVVAPILDEARGQPLAMLVLRANAETQLAPLLQAGAVAELKLADHTNGQRLSAASASEASAKLYSEAAVPDSAWKVIATAPQPSFDEPGSMAWMFGSLALGWLALSSVAVAFLRQRHSHEQALRSSLDQLQASEERYLTTLMSIGDGLITTDAEGRIALLDPVAEQLTGWPQQDACGRPIEEVFQIINETSRVPVEVPVRRAIREEVVVGMDNHTLLIARDGSERPISDSGAPIRATSGAIIGGVLIFRDQSAERAATESLRATKELLSQTSRIARIGGWEFDVRAKRLIWSEVIYAIHEVEREVQPDLSMATNYYKPGPSREAIRRAVQACIEQGESFDLELEFVSAHGRELWVRSVGQPSFEDGRCVKIWGVFQDITQQRQLQQQLLTAQKIEAVGRLAAGIAHDYNNALQAILGNAELALASNLNGPLSRYLEEIRAAAQRSTAITRQLLGFARSRLAQPRPIDMNAVSEQMIAMLRRLIRENITLSWQPERALWPVLLDPAQLDQIITNLTLNARDAIGAAGTITITTTNVVVHKAEPGGPTPGEYVLLMVRDNGMGMDRHTQEQLFEPFFTTKPPGQGTGLGMPSVANIVHQSNGVVTVESAPGVDTTVRVYLPRAQDATAAHAEVDPAMPLPVRSDVTVLLCEDDEAVRDLGQRILVRLGYSVLTAATPEAALSLATSHPGPIDLLITDMVMPELSGPELVRRMLRRRPTLRWLLMSGHAAETLTQEGSLPDKASFIQKPFSIAELALKVREVLE